MLLLKKCKFLIEATVCCSALWAVYNRIVIDMKSLSLK